MQTHEDNRRIIYDWAQGNFKSAKAVIIKEDNMVVGDHYHKNKEESFFLLSGRFDEIVVGDYSGNNIEAPFYIHVPKETYHRFICSKGSVLLGVATELFDPNDEIKQ